MVNEVRYSAFGGMRYLNGETVTDLLYTSRRFEEELGIYYYGARWYDSSLGRFIQADSIVSNAGNNQAYDRYAYVNNNPLIYTDPTGNSILGIILVVTFVAAVTLPWITRDVPIAEEVLDSTPEDIEQEFNDRLDLTATIVSTGTTAGLVTMVASEAAMYCGANSGNVSMYKWGAEQNGLLNSEPQLTTTNRYNTNNSPEIDFNENNENTVHHIMQSKHGWDQFVRLTGDEMEDYKNVQPYIQQSVRNNFNQRTISVNPNGKPTEFIGIVNKKFITTTGIIKNNNSFTISDAYVGLPRWFTK